MTSVWDVGSCDQYDEAQTGDAVSGIASACGECYAALQAPADALLEWFAGWKQRIFRKLDKAGDKLVVGILETVYAIRDRLGPNGPPYSVATSAPGSSKGEGLPLVADVGTRADDLTPGPSTVGATADTQSTSGDVEVLPGAPVSRADARQQVMDADLDTPLVFLFGERSAPWHQRAVAWAGQWLQDILSTSSLQDLIDSRSQGQATRMPDRIGDITFGE